MAMFTLLKIRTSIDIFKNEKCKVTFCLEYICILWYGIFGESDMKLYDEMSSRLGVGCKVKGGSTSTEMLKTMAQRLTIAKYCFEP